MITTPYIYGTPEHSRTTFALPTLSVMSEENGRCVNTVYQVDY